jgi:glutathione S-transferase
MLTLYLANKNYSSWSLRGWFAARLSGLPFREVMVPLAGQTPNPAYLGFAPNGLVPCLHDGEVVVWESISIAEYLAERSPGMWPAASDARAFARSMCAEMHAGFRDLRNDMTMCVRERVDVRPWSDRLASDIERVRSLWDQARTRFGAGGPYLFGTVSLADAFFAPVVFRFQTYGVDLPGVAGGYQRALLAHPWMREWEQAALAETSVVEADEPRFVYREKLARLGRL